MLPINTLFTLDIKAYAAEKEMRDVVIPSLASS